MSLISRYGSIISLILAGEAIFFLPFVIPRVFRPTFLEIYDLTNYELGLAFSAYGIIAMISYFFGGFLADIFKPRILLSIALVVTGLSGLLLLLGPDPNEMIWLYGFWGVSTILLFWSALIKATRSWGQSNDQKLAFGLLDGGRGATAAIVGSIAAAVFAWLLQEEQVFEDKVHAFHAVILIFIGSLLAISVLVFVILPKEEAGKKDSKNKVDLRKLLSVVRWERIWLLAGMVVCAYVGYKATDNSSLYAHDVLGFSDQRSAVVGNLVLWLRPVVAVSIALTPKRFAATGGLILSFAIMSISAAIFGFAGPSEYVFIIFLFNTILLCAGIYAARVLYFAVLEEARIPLNKTGTAVGFISIIGFTPDVFFGPATGYLLDVSPGLEGHQHLYQFLLIFAVIGFVLSVMFRRRMKSLCRS